MRASQLTANKQNYPQVNKTTLGYMRLSVGAHRKNTHIEYGGT